jgi:hypothetical protein
VGGSLISPAVASRSWPMTLAVRRSPAPTPGSCFDERREAEARAREVVERTEQQAIEADRVRRASIWGGMPADHLPTGVSAASAMFAADRDARPRRQSPLQHALSNEGGIVFHPIRGDEDQSCHCRNHCPPEAACN